MARQTIYTGLRADWRELLEQASALTVSAPQIRVRSITLSIELEDVLAEWRELWSAPWFARELDQLITSEWTLKDVVAHIGSWSTEFRVQAEKLAAGSEFESLILFEQPGGPRAWNAEQVAQRRMQPIDALIGEVERETGRLQDLLLQLESSVLLVERPIGIAAATTPNGPWIRSLAGLIKMRCFHDRHHIGRIREWQRSKFTGEF